MSRLIVKYAVLLAFTLVVLSFLKFIFLNLRLSSSVEGAVRFVAIGTIMMFAINEFLKRHNSKNEYHFGTGFTLSFAIGLFGILISFTILSFLNFILNGQQPELNYLLASIKPPLYKTVVLSIMIPTTFSKKRNKKEPEIERKYSDDILDR